MVKLCIREAAVRLLWKTCRLRANQSGLASNSAIHEPLCLKKKVFILLVFGLFPHSGFAQEHRLAISLDRERVEAGRVAAAEIEAALNRAPNAWTALTKSERRKATFALFKTLKFHARPNGDGSQNYFVLTYGRITYCVSWPDSGEENPCESRKGPE